MAKVANVILMPRHMESTPNLGAVVRRKGETIRELYRCERISIAF